MKRSFYFIALIVTAGSLALSSVGYAGSKEDKKTAKTAPLAEPKVSKKDAEHAVLFQYRGGNVEKIVLIQGKDHSNWLVDVFPAGGRSAIQVQVDGMTGKIIEGDMKSATATSSQAPSRKGGMGY